MTEFVARTADRKTVQEALDRSQELYRLLVENIDEIVYIVDVRGDPLQGTLQFISAQMEHILGYSPQEFLHDPGLWMRALHADDVASVVAVTRQLAAKQTAATRLYRMRHKNGAEYRWLEDRVVPQHDAAGNLVAFFGVARDVTQRKQAEETLRESEERHRTLVENLSDVVFTQDVQGTLSYVSPAIAHISSYTALDLQGQPFSRFIHPEDLPLLRASRERTLAGQAEPLEFRVLDKDGSVRWVRTSSRPLLEGGRVVGLIGILTDITDRKRAEALRDGQAGVLEMIATNAALEETLACLSRLIESQVPGMLCSILLLEDDGLHIRHGAAPSLPEAYVRAIDGACIGPRAGSCGTAMFRRQPVIVTDILEDPLWEDYRSVAAPFGLRACWSVPIVSHQGNVLGSFAMYYHEPRSPTANEMRLLDLATHMAGIAIQRHRAEKSLRQAEEKYRNIFDHAVEGIFQSTPEGRFLVVNPAMARMAGFSSPQEMVASVNNIDQQLFVDPQRRAELKRLLDEHGFVQGFEFEGYRKDGSRRWISESARAVRDPHGALLYYEGTVEDITQRKQLEEQFRQAQKMEAVGQLAGGVAHDFNNLLTVILGCSDLLLGSTHEEDPSRTLLREIQKAAERAASLTRQLLAFSRKQVLAPQVLDLNTLVAEMEKMLRRLIGEHITLCTNLGPDLAKVKADPGQLEQVIVNLGVNARDAMPRGGRLAIETANVDLGADFARQHPEVRPGPYVRLRVSDTGSGMTPEVAAHIFEPFFTTKERGKGTGLGLATVYGIIRQSDGHIFVDSSPDRGTIFDIFLPQVHGVQPIGKSSAGQFRPRSGVETVLLVEDEEPVRKLAAIVLETAGYTVLQAAEAAEALQVSERHPGPIHLLLTDVVMPGQSGPDLAEQLLARRPGVKVLYSTGYTDNAFGNSEVLQPGMAIVHKPFTPTILTRRVREVLDQQ